MKTRIVFLFCIVLLLFSCYGNKKDRRVNSEDLQQKSERVTIEEPIVVDVKEEVNIQNVVAPIDDATKESISSKVTATEEEKKAMSEFIFGKNFYMDDMLTNRRITSIDRKPSDGL